MKEEILRFIREQAPEGVVIGVSGGVDSAVVAFLCVEALGRDNVMGLFLPSATTPREDFEDAYEVARILGMEWGEIDIQPMLSPYKRLSERTLGNVKARMRMTLLYSYANEKGRRVAGTGDYSEHFVGYYTKYGDGGTDFEPIGNLTKTEVRKLAGELGVPQRIIDKPSSPRLWEGHEAEKELGLTYEQIDKVIEMHRASEHKRRLPPSP